MKKIVSGTCFLGQKCRINTNFMRVREPAHTSAAMNTGVSVRECVQAMFHHVKCVTQPPNTAILFPGTCHWKFFTVGYLTQIQAVANLLITSKGHRWMLRDERHEEKLLKCVVCGGTSGCGCYLSHLWWGKNGKLSCLHKTVKEFWQSWHLLLVFMNFCKSYKESNHFFMDTLIRTLTEDYMIAKEQLAGDRER